MMRIEEELEEGLPAAVPLVTEGFSIHIDLVVSREGYRPMTVRSLTEIILALPDPNSGTP